MSYYHPSGMGPERQQHIDDMFQHPMLSQCRAVGPDRSTFDIPLVLKEGHCTTLRISLPPHFPQERPTLTVLAPVQHPQVDSSGRVLTPSIMEWNYPFSRLVTTVWEAFQSLSGMPPDYRTRPTSTPSPQPLPPQSSSTSMPMSILSASSSSPSTSPTRPRPNSMASMASIPPPHPQEVTSLVRAELRGRTPAELQKMLAGDSPELKALLSAVVKKSQAAQAVEAAKASLKAAVEANLEMEGTLASARTQVAIVRSSELDVHRATCEELAARQQAVLSALGPQKIMAAVEDALSAADHKADALRDEVRAGSLPLDKFLDSYIAARKEYHVLSAKRQAAEVLLPRAQ